LCNLASKYLLSTDGLNAEMMLAKKLLVYSMSKSSALDKLKVVKEFSNLWTLMHMALNFSVSNAKCEISFSLFKQVKSFFQSTMSQD
jgi:hypothetical protein